MSMSAATRNARLVTGLALCLSATLGAGVARAQDPFAMLDAHGAMSAQARDAADMHSRYSRRDDDEPERRSPPPRSLSAAERAALDAFELEERAQEAARIERWRNGFWEFFRSNEPADPGEWCAAMFVSSQGMLTLTGADETWDGALLLFAGKDVPKPRRNREVTTTLTQIGAPPATVRAFLFAADPAMEGFGTIAFALPSMDDAVGGTLDENEFVVEIDGREVFRLSYKDGARARDELRSCLRRR
ncbi:MAG: hypothetical protein M3Q74_06970 [Pseudomonadota bacterium]|nr:hypothetical protein [Pseudomonadota bacterium]